MCLKVLWGRSIPTWYRRLGRRTSIRSTYKDEKPRTAKMRSQSDEIRIPSSSQSNMRISKQAPKRKNRPRKSGNKIVKLIKIFLGLVLVCIFSLFILESRFNSTILTLAKARAQIIATESINVALSTEIAEEIHYENLIIWKTDGEGRIVAMQPNTSEINRIAALTTVKVQEALKAATNENVSIPFGYVFGSKFLASLGPMVKVTILPVGTVSTVVKDSFENAGINQVRHRIYMDISANIKIVIPLSSTEVSVDTTMIISESVILGEVPQYYVDTNGQGLLGGGLSVDGITPTY